MHFCLIQQEKFESESNHQGDDDDEMIENEDDLYQRQLKAAERILEEAKTRVTRSKGTNTEAIEMNTSGFKNQVNKTILYFSKLIFIPTNQSLFGQRF